MAAVKSLAPTRSSAPYVYRMFTACTPHAHRACPKPTASVKSPKLGAAVGRPTAGMHGIVPDSQPCSSSSSATSHPSPHSAELHTSAIAHHAVKRTAKRFTRATMGASRESGPPTRLIELAGTMMSLPQAPRRQSACCSRDRAAVFRKQLAAEIAREVLLELDAMMVAAQRGSPSTVTWSTLSYSAPASYVLWRMASAAVVRGSILTGRRIILPSWCLPDLVGALYWRPISPGGNSGDHGANPLVNRKSPETAQ